MPETLIGNGCRLSDLDFRRSGGTMADQIRVLPRLPVFAPQTSVAMSNPVLEFDSGVTTRTEISINLVLIRQPAPGRFEQLDCTGKFLSRHRSE